MKYKNAIISTGKDILIVFICFFIFMFLSGGGTQNVLAAEDEVTITLDANGGKAVEPVVYKKTQSKIGILPETTRTGYVFNGWWTKNGGTSSSDSAWGGIVKFNDTSLPSSDTTYYARWTEDKDENNKQKTYFYGKTDEKIDRVTYNYGYISDSTERGITYNYGHIEKAFPGTYNYGYIDCLISSSRTLTYNYGKITDSQSRVGTNYGTIEKNNASVDTNNGIIENNTGTINRYSSDATLNENSGTINTLSKGSVRKNTGKINDVNDKNVTIYNYAGGTVGKSDDAWGVRACTVWNMGGIVQGYSSYADNVKVYNFEGGTVSNLRKGSVIYNLGGTVTDSSTAQVINCYKVNINSSFVETWNDKFIINPDTGEVWLPEGETGTFTVKDGTPQLYVTGATLTKQSDTAYTLSDAQATIVVDDVEPFTITYDLNGGTVDGNPMTYTERDTITLKNPTKENYVFVGWTGTDIEEPSDNVTIQKGSKGNRQYTAVWKQDSNIVILTFDGQNDTKDQLMIYNILTGGDTIGKLPEVTKEGYHFLGWFTAKEGGTELTAASKKPHKNTTYYAQWAIGTYTYTLDPNGGTPNSTTKITKVYKENIGILPIISKEGYIFNGWWSRNDKGNWVSVLEPNSAMEGQDTAYYARWTRKIDTYSDTTGVYLYSHFEGSLKKNTGTVVNNFGLIERNVSTVTTNYGEVGATETAISNNYGHVGTVEDKIISNNGVVDLVIDTASIRYNNNIVKDNQGILIYNNGKIEKNAGIITENNNYIGENTETVKFNAKGAEINVNKGIIRENKGVVYNYPGGIVKKNSGIVYNYGGMVSEDNTGSVIESYSVKAGKGIEKATLDNESFLDIDGAKWLEKTKGTATLTVVWAKGYNANGYHLEADGCKVTKNTNGTYTLSKITKNTTIFAAPTTFTITYKSENGNLQTTNPVTYTCETEDITLAAPSREGSTFLGWTGTDLAGTTKNVTIKKGSFGDRIYTAVWNNESQTVQQEIFILPKVLVKGKAIQKLSWNKIDEADGYFIYSSVSGKKMKKVFDTRKRASKKKAKKSSAKSTGAKTVTYTFKKRKSGTVYQYQIRAYKLVNGKKKVFCKSMVVYSVANNQSGKLTNVKNIKLKKKSYTLQVKQTAKIKAKYTAYKKNKKLYSRVKTFRYISSNTNVATVTKAGKIKAVKAGTCTIYVLAHNGVRKAVKVTVK